MEQVARMPDAKGVIWERKSHPLQEEMARWAAAQERTAHGCFSVEQLYTGGETRGEDAETSRPSKSAKLLANAERPRDVAGPDEVQAACERVVAALPPALRGPMSGDAKALADMLLRLCPTSPWITIQVEVVTTLAACTRWHQDKYSGRALITYTGPGTWCVDDASVCYDQFTRTLGMPMEESDPLIVPNFSSIHKPESNAVVLLKGNDWKGIRGVGQTHKAPNVDPYLKRLILKVDVSVERPETAF